MELKTKILGFVPARMAASRFPGKPLARILGRPMIEHVFRRAQKFKNWDGLYLATCDYEIADVGRAEGWPVIMTSASHTRCLDRIAEAAEKCGQEVAEDDIVVCVQGDEPMLHPDMIRAAIEPLQKRADIPCTVLAMEIAEEEQFLNPDTVKIVHNEKGAVLYTSRAPVPYCKGAFSVEHGAKRIYGIFAFRWRYLKRFTKLNENMLERLESCDSNRILDADFRQYIAPYTFQKSFSVDSPNDLRLVEEHMATNGLWGSY
jgi:3-deoxy-manno-octulosonate cytidylyltransferase (CMP-KDO synthetase)